MFTICLAFITKLQPLHACLCCFWFHVFFSVKFAGSSEVTGDVSASPLKVWNSCLHSSFFPQICFRIWNWTFQVWEASFGANIVDAASQQIYDASKLADQLVMESKSAKRIGFIGLGAMGFGMASHLLRSGFYVVAYDVSCENSSDFFILPNFIINLCIVAIGGKMH